MSRDLAIATLGAALRDADTGVSEEGGENTGHEIRRFQLNADPPIHEAVPWCALAVQKWSDVAAKGLAVANPLDAVRLEAYVQDYHETMKHRVIGPAVAVERGDLVLFSFGGKRWDHIGIVAVPPDNTGEFYSVEGNTSDENQREGDRVARKRRSTRKTYKVEFIRWW